MGRKIELVITLKLLSFNVELMPSNLHNNQKFFIVLGVLWVND